MVFPILLSVLEREGILQEDGTTNSVQKMPFFASHFGVVSKAE